MNLRLFNQSMGVGLVLLSFALSDAGMHSAQASPKRLKPTVETQLKIQRRKEFRLAIIQNNLPLIVKHLADGMDLKRKFRQSALNFHGTPLDYAAKRGNLGTLQVLWKSGVDLDFEEAFTQAIHYEHLEIVDYLLSVGFQPTIKELDYLFKYTSQDSSTEFKDAFEEKLLLYPYPENVKIEFYSRTISRNRPELFHRVAQLVGWELSDEQNLELTKKLEKMLRIDFVEWMDWAPEAIVYLLNQDGFWIRLLSEFPENSPEEWRTVFTNMAQDLCDVPEATRPVHRPFKSCLQFELSILNHRNWMQTFLGEEGFETILNLVQEGKAQRERILLDDEYARVIATFKRPMRVQQPMAGASRECPGCYEESPVESRLNLSIHCSDECRLCRECLLRCLSLRTQFPEDAVCPGCSGELNPGLLFREMEQREMSPGDINEVHALFLNKIKSMQQAKTELPCEDPRCMGVITGEAPGRRTCSHCREALAMCKSCEDIHPSDITCMQWSQIQKSTQENDASLLREAQSPEAKIRPCPHCNAMSEKTEGCNHMRCYRCGKNWNWNGSDGSS